MLRYFKLVCLSGDTPWFLDEFRSGRLRFGWSGPNADLRVLSTKTASTRSDGDRATWRYSQFLLWLVPGDRVVVQFEQPMRSFVVGEVVAPGYDFDSQPREDFNHIVHVRPVVLDPVPTNARAVSASLKHDLTKRGAHYEVYPERSIRELDALVDAVIAGTLDRGTVRTDDDTFDATLREIRGATIRTLSQRWPSKEFEKLCVYLCRQMEHVEVADHRDTYKGWDFRVRIRDPLTGSVLVDNVPVQCKNYRGPVDSTRALDDLVRCIEQSESEIKRAFLFILGDLTENFEKQRSLREAALREKYGDSVTLSVIDQDRIADLYIAALGRGNALDSDLE